jgi:hypothetical protein
MAIPQSGRGTQAMPSSGEADFGALAARDA